MHNKFECTQTCIMHTFHLRTEHFVKLSISYVYKKVYKIDLSNFPKTSHAWHVKPELDFH